MRDCLACGEPLVGMRADAKRHPECKNRDRNGKAVLSERFWREVGKINTRGTRTWIRSRDS